MAVRSIIFPSVATVEQDISLVFYRKQGGAGKQEKTSIRNILCFRTVLALSISVTYCMGT